MASGPGLRLAERATYQLIMVGWLEAVSKWPASRISELSIIWEFRQDGCLGWLLAVSPSLRSRPLSVNLRYLLGRSRTSSPTGR